MLDFFLIHFVGMNFVIKTNYCLCANFYSLISAFLLNLFCKMSIAVFNAGLERFSAKYAICKLSFFVFSKSQILTCDNQIVYIGSSVFTFSLNLRFVRSQLHFED